MNSNSYTRLVELPNEQSHAKPPNGPHNSHLWKFPHASVIVFQWKQKAQFLRPQMENPMSVDAFTHYVVFHAPTETMQPIR